MASESEASCDADPNFAVICAFLEKFGPQCGLQTVDFVDLQQMLENTQEVSPVLIDLHIKLLRKIRKSVTAERWERAIVKVCHTFSNQDAWEIERFGYKKARLSAKLRLLKELLEMQFDNNQSFKNKINVITAKELRSHPIGRDKLGNAYWYQIDDSCQIRVYKEDPDEETWALVAKDRDGLVTLISKLNDNQDSSSTDAVTNEDSNSNNEETKTVLDTGQQDSNSSKKSSDDDKPPELQQEVDVDDEDTKMEGKDLAESKMPDLLAPQEEKKPELSGIKEKYIRSDNFVQSNRKAVQSAGFVDIISNADLKRPMVEDIEEPSLVKRPRTARPTLLGNKKKPYQQVEEEEMDEEDEEDDDIEEEEDEDLDDEEEEDFDDDDEVGEAIEEPLMLVTGKGSGKANKCGNPIVGEVVEEEVMFFYGEGTGRDCETGNEEKKTDTEKNDDDKQKDSSIISPTKNSFKLGMIIDSKSGGTDKSLIKNTPSRWDMGKPGNVIEDEGGNVKNLVNKFESINKDNEDQDAVVANVSKAPMFFFGPRSGFSFKSPTPSKVSVTMGFGSSYSSPGSNSTSVVKDNSINKKSEVQSLIEPEAKEKIVNVEESKINIDSKSNEVDVKALTIITDQAVSTKSKIDSKVTEQLECKENHKQGVDETDATVNTVEKCPVLNNPVVLAEKTETDAMTSSQRLEDDAAHERKSLIVESRPENEQEKHVQPVLSEVIPVLPVDTLPLTKDIAEIQEEKQLDISQNEKEQTNEVSCVQIDDKPVLEIVKPVLEQSESVNVDNIIKNDETSTHVKPESSSSLLLVDIAPDNIEKHENNALQQSTILSDVPLIPTISEQEITKTDVSDVTEKKITENVDEHKSDGVTDIQTNIKTSENTSLSSSTASEIELKDSQFSQKEPGTTEVVSSISESEEKITKKVDFVEVNSVAVDDVKSIVTTAPILIDNKDREERTTCDDKTMVQDTVVADSKSDDEVNCVEMIDTVQRDKNTIEDSDNQVVEKKPGVVLTKTVDSDLAKEIVDVVEEKAEQIEVLIDSKPEVVTLVTPNQLDMSLDTSKPDEGSLIAPETVVAPKGDEPVNALKDLDSVETPEELENVDKVTEEVKSQVAEVNDKVEDEILEKVEEVKLPTQESAGEMDNSDLLIKEKIEDEILLKIDEVQEIAVQESSKEEVEQIETSCEQKSDEHKIIVTQDSTKEEPEPDVLVQVSKGATPNIVEDEEKTEPTIEEPVEPLEIKNNDIPVPEEIEEMEETPEEIKETPKIVHILENKIDEPVKSDVVLKENPSVSVETSSETVDSQECPNEASEEKPSIHIETIIDDSELIGVTPKKEEGIASDVNEASKQVEENVDSKIMEADTSISESIDKESTVAIKETLVEVKNVKTAEAKDSHDEANIVDSGLTPEKSADLDEELTLNKSETNLISRSSAVLCPDVSDNSANKVDDDQKISKIEEVLKSSEKLSEKSTLLEESLKVAEESKSTENIPEGHLGLPQPSKTKHEIIAPTSNQKLSKVFVETTYKELDKISKPVEAEARKDAQESINQPESSHQLKDSNITVDLNLFEKQTFHEQIEHKVSLKTSEIVTETKNTEPSMPKEEIVTNSNKSQELDPASEVKHVITSPKEKIKKSPIKVLIVNPSVKHVVEPGKEKLEPQVPQPQLHSISKLINEVPKPKLMDVKGHDKRKVVESTEFSRTLGHGQKDVRPPQISATISVVDSFKQQKFVEQHQKSTSETYRDHSTKAFSKKPKTAPTIDDILGKTSVTPQKKLQNEGLLDLSCAKVTPEPNIMDLTSKNQHNPPDIVKENRYTELSKEPLPPYLQPRSDFVAQTLRQVQALTMPILPMEIPKVQQLGHENLQSVHLHHEIINPPIGNYDEPEQIEELNVAKSFFMGNDCGSAPVASIENEDTNEEPVIIQEIGSMSSSGFKKQKLSVENDLQELGKIEKQIFPIDEEEDIVKIRQAQNVASVLEVDVPKPGPQLTVKEFTDLTEVPCEQKKVALLHEESDQSDGDMMGYDGGNVSEDMELEDSKDGQIIEHDKSEQQLVPEEEESVIPDEPKILTRRMRNALESNQADKVVSPKVSKKENKKEEMKAKELKTKEEAKTEDEPVTKEESKPKEETLQSFTMDYTGEAPDLSHVHAMTRRSLKRGAAEEPPKEQEDEEAGGKRRKIRGKRTVDKDLRKSVEDAKNKEVSSSDEEKKPVEEKAKPEKKPRQKRKKLLLGLDIPEEGVVLPSGLRQSRRIAQIKIKEEAERRKLEEIALDEMKKSQAKKNKKEEEKDKDYKAEKRKHNKIITEDETTNDTELEGKKKKKKRRKHKEFDEEHPWRTSSDSSSEDSHVEEEEEEEEENYIETVKSDHEFSPESDLENSADPQPLKRARTVRKEDEEQEEVDDTNCQKCNKSDHPEWILLCDGCDAGWHCSCLRPALLVIPEGDWYCPPCQHNNLVKLLQTKLVEFDKIQSKKEVELRRKERLAYVGISLANVLPDKTEEREGKKERIRKPRVRVSGDESSSSSASDSGSGSGSSSSSGSGSSSSDSDEPIYKLRQRRQEHSYRFKEYDELIKSATQVEVEEKKEIVPEIRGKDMATIVQAELKENKEPEEGPKEEEESEDDIRPVKKILGKKKHRKLNSLDISSEEDEDSDEDFKGSSSEEEDDDEEYNESSSNSSIIGKRRKGRGAVRRSARARIRRFDREFINDDSEDSEPRKRGRGRSDWEESDESEESDDSWGRKKKRTSGAKAKPAGFIPTKRKKSKKKFLDDSDPDVYKKKKSKIKFGLDDDDDDDEAGKRRTRGKKINYLDALGTDSSEEDKKRRNQLKPEESEDEFVLNEEEDDVQDEEGREDGSSDDSNIGGLVPAVKKGSKKGKGKGGIKRIKRAQGEEEEALFPPLPDASGDMETNPIEQINKNLEAMDEKEIGLIMEDEEYANRQLQMVAAQLEKEKRRKEMEARKLEMLSQPLQPVAVAVPVPVPVEDPATIPPIVGPTVIQAMPVVLAPQNLSQHHQLQPIHHDLPHPSMHHQLSPMHHQPPPPAAQLPHLSPQHVPPQSPQLINHPQHQPPPHQLPPHQPPGMMIAADTPKKRGRKPKSLLTTPTEVNDLPFMSTPSTGDKSDDSEMSFNSDGTPKKRRGRGKGKKTLEKEAAAAAVLASVQKSPGPTSVPPASASTAKAGDTNKTEASERPVPEIVKKSIADGPPIPMVGGKLGVASAPQPFSQSQPKPSVITRMLQNQPCQPAYPVGGVTHNFGPDRPPEPRLQGHPFGPGGIPPRGLHPGAFRPAANHYPVIRSGAPPIRPFVPPHIFHHPMENPSGPPMPERSSPALTSPASASPLSSKGDPTPPPPAYTVRPPMVRFPPAGGAPPPPRHPQMLPQMHQRPPYTTAPPHNYHYPAQPQYVEAGPPGPGPGPVPGPYQPVPPSYQEPPFAGDPEGQKNYEEEENGEFGGLVSYFSSQREDDLDT